MTTLTAEEVASRDDDIWHKHGASEYPTENQAASTTVVNCNAVLRIILSYLSITWDRKRCLDLVRNETNLTNIIKKAQRTRKYTALIEYGAYLVKVTGQLADGISQCRICSCRTTGRRNTEKASMTFLKPSDLL